MRFLFLIALAVSISACASTGTSTQAQNVASPPTGLCTTAELPSNVRCYTPNGVVDGNGIPVGGGERGRVGL